MCYFFVLEIHSYKMLTSIYCKKVKIYLSISIFIKKFKSVNNAIKTLFYNILYYKKYF